MITEKQIKDLMSLSEKATQKFYTQHPKMEHFKDYLIGVDGCEEKPFVLADLNRNMDNWKNDLNYLAAANPETISKLCKMVLQVEGLLKCVEFYAEEQNWKIVSDTRDRVIIEIHDWSDPRNQYSNDSRGDTHGGKRARLALAAYREATK